MSPFKEIEKSILKYIWNHKRPQIAKAILSKKSNAGGITMADFKLYHRVVVAKPAWNWPKNRQSEQFSTIETKKNPHSYRI
jgi:hypothetical protein